MNIYHQLLLGARFLDLRVCKHPKRRGEPYCAHGGFRTIPFKDVLQQLTQFLTSHPTEIVVLSVRRDVAYMHGRASIGMVESDFWVALYLKEYLGPRLTADITVGELADRKQNVLYFFEERERYIPSVESHAAAAVPAAPPPRSEAREAGKRLSVPARLPSQPTQQPTMPSSLARPRRTVVGTLLSVQKLLRRNAGTPDPAAAPIAQPPSLSPTPPASDKEEEEEPYRLERHMFSMWIRSNMERYAIDRLIQQQEEEHHKPVTLPTRVPTRVQLPPSPVSPRGARSPRAVRRVQRRHSYPALSVVGAMTQKPISPNVTKVIQGRRPLKTRRFPRSDSLPFLVGHEPTTRRVERSLGKRHRKMMMAESSFPEKLMRFESRRTPLQRKQTSRFLTLQKLRSQRRQDLDEDQGAASDRSGITAVHAANAVKRLLSQSAGIGSPAAWRPPEHEWANIVNPQRRGRRQRQRPIDDRPVYSDPEMRGLVTRATRWARTAEPLLTPTPWTDGETATQQRNAPTWVTHGVRARTADVTNLTPDFRSAFHGPHMTGNRVARAGGSRTFGPRRRRSLFAPTLDRLASRRAEPSPLIAEVEKPQVLREAEPLPVSAVRPRPAPIKVGRPSLLTPFVAGKTRITKSWTVTSDPNPKLLCKKLLYWSQTEGVVPPRQAFVLRILAGEITPPSLGSQEPSVSVLKFWTVQGASALVMRKGGLQLAAVETHKHLLTDVLRRSITNRVNGITHDFINEKIVSRIVKLNVLVAAAHQQQQKMPKQGALTPL